jgi:phosphoesterase RecJ-like protein
LIPFNLFILNKKHIQALCQLQEELSRPRRIIVTTHQGPDGDAMGSSLALYCFLKKKGHHVTAVTPNDYPEFLHWLPFNSEAVNYMRQKDIAEKLIAEAEYIFHLDYSQIKRSADMTRSLSRSGAVKIMIDHHIGPDLPVKYMFSEIGTSSTCELLYGILKEWDVSVIDFDIATCLYTGIMTDTGCFCYGSADAETFTVAAELIGYGIDRDKISGNIYDNYSEDRMKLMGYCLNEKMQVFPEYRTALISLSLQEQQRYHFEVGDSEGFVNLPLSIKGIRFTAFFLEKDDKIKISFRSKGNFSTNNFSKKHFKGGGHVNAAGGEMKKTLEETVDIFKNLLPLYKEKLNAD